MHQFQLERGDRLRRYAATAVIACIAIVAGLLASTPAQAAPRDNLVNARLCLHDGWKTLKTSNGRSFRNLGSCVVYALFGGTFGLVSTPGGGE